MKRFGSILTFILYGSLLTAGLVDFSRDGITIVDIAKALYRMFTYNDVWAKVCSLLFAMFFVTIALTVLFAFIGIFTKKGGLRSTSRCAFCAFLSISVILVIYTIFSGNKSKSDLIFAGVAFVLFLLSLISNPKLGKKNKKAKKGKKGKKGKGEQSAPQFGFSYESNEAFNASGGRYRIPQGIYDSYGDEYDLGPEYDGPHGMYGGIRY